MELSSTEVRQALAQGGGADLLPPAVYGYVLREKLYGTHKTLTGLTPDELRPIALSYLKPKRMPHVLGTEQEAVRLVRRYGGDETQARIAALLHDCTKKLDMPEQLALCAQYGIELDELEQKALKLLHSKTGAAIARDVFGVEDAVYDAIWYHTTGKPDMTRLEKIIYLADYIEPSRDFDGVETLRQRGVRGSGPRPAYGAEHDHTGDGGDGQPRPPSDPRCAGLLIEKRDTMKTPKELALLAARALSDKKGKEIQALEIADLTTLADYFVLATGSSNTQINALVDNVEKVLHEEAGEDPLHREGYRGGTWVLLDYGCIAVHVFNHEAREFYGLERLWRDGKPLDLTGVTDDHE